MQAKYVIIPWSPKFGRRELGCHCFYLDSSSTCDLREFPPPAYCGQSMWLMAVLQMKLVLQIRQP